MRALFTALLLLIGLLGSQTASAHEGRPLLVRLMQQDGITHLTWQTPPVVPAGAEPAVVIEGCAALDQPIHGLLGQGRFNCSQADSQADSQTDGPPTLRIIWPTINPALSTLVEQKGGTTRFYGPEVTQIPLADITGGEADLVSFIETGIEHILVGNDHLLFIFGLTLLVLLGPSNRKAHQLALMVTGFTIAHSLTLGLSIFDLITLPTPPVEAVIALSVMFVGLELARNKQDTLTWRYPALTASAFGLLHGLGFASVLSDIGIANDARILGLFGFNLGVEIGQLAFVALTVAGALVLRSLLTNPMLARAQFISALIIGAVSVNWMTERVVGFWG